MVPEGWRIDRVGSVLSEMTAGVSVNSTDIPASDGQIGILKTSCVSRGRFDPHKNKAVIESKEIIRVRQPVQAGTIIVSRMNTPELVGANGYVNADFPNLFLPDRLWSLKHKKIVNGRWLGFWFSSPHTRYALSALGTGTSGSMKNITKEDVRSIPIAIPPLPEQKKIAEILSTWDRAIETTEKLLANAEAQKRALMQQLLTGKRRLKGFEGGEWKSIAIGRVWKVTTGQPAPNSSDDFCSDGIPFLRVSSLAPLLEGASERSFEKVSSATADQYRLKLFPAGTVVFAKSGMSAKLGRVYRLAGEAYLVSHLAALLPNRSKGDERFLFYYLQMFPPSDLIQGDGFPSIKTSLIAERHISLPSLPEQTAIADCLDALEQVATNYRVQLNSLILEKRALMQQLLTGKRRVTV